MDALGKELDDDIFDRDKYHMLSNSSIFVTESLERKDQTGAKKKLRRERVGQLTFAEAQRPVNTLYPRVTPIPIGTPTTLSAPSGDSPFSRPKSASMYQRAWGFPRVRLAAPLQCQCLASLPRLAPLRLVPMPAPDVHSQEVIHQQHMITIPTRTRSKVLAKVGNAAPPQT